MPFKTTIGYNQLDGDEKIHVFKGLSSTEYFTGINPPLPPSTGKVEHDLVGWWDASDSTRVTASGNNVTDWRSSSSLGLVSTTATGTPLTGVKTKNSLNVIFFNSGSNHNLTPTSTDTTHTNYTFHVVYMYGFDANGANDAYAPMGMGEFMYHVGGNFAGGINAPNSQSIIMGGPGNIAAFSGTDISKIGKWNIDTVYATGNFNTMIMRSNGVDLTIVGRNNVVTNLTLNGGSWSFLGLHPYSNTAESCVQIAEILCYGAVLTSDEITQNENYLNSKWNVY